MTQENIFAKAREHAVILAFINTSQGVVDIMAMLAVINGDEGWWFFTLVFIRSIVSVLLLTVANFVIHPGGKIREVSELILILATAIGGSILVANSLGAGFLQKTLPMWVVYPLAVTATINLGPVLSPVFRSIGDALAFLSGWSLDGTIKGLYYQEKHQQGGEE